MHVYEGFAKRRGSMEHQPGYKTELSTGERRLDKPTVGFPPVCGSSTKETNMLQTKTEAITILVVIMIPIIIY